MELELTRGGAYALPTAHTRMYAHTHTHMHMYTCTHTRAHMYARTHTHTHAHTQNVIKRKGQLLVTAAPADDWATEVCGDVKLGCSASEPKMGGRGCKHTHTHTHTHTHIQTETHIFAVE